MLKENMKKNEMKAVKVVLILILMEHAQRDVEYDDDKDVHRWS